MPDPTAVRDQEPGLERLAGEREGGSVARAEDGEPDPARTSRDRQQPPWTVGIVGGGQLARMTCEAASALGIPTVVLAESRHDAATMGASDVVLGRPGDERAMSVVAERCDVITFDHEQVDLDLLTRLEQEGTVVRPGTVTLEMAVDKSAMRSRLAAAGLPVPPFAALGRLDADRARQAIDRFAADHGWPLVVKAARGGYDGKGVWPVHGPAEAGTVCERAADAGIPLLVEQMVAIDAELAVLVARRPDGTVAVWPAVETTQVDGVCREVLLPGRLDPPLAAEAEVLGRKVAEVAGAVGVMAVELFWTGNALLVNEVAARPHNSGHWTIEGAVTSQFENHLRAVLDLPLGDTSPTARFVASVNVFGSASASGGAPDPLHRLADALAIPGAHVHVYGKQPRPGRKLGHVTTCGDDEGDVRSRAWKAAVALGSPPLAADPSRDGGGR